LQAEALYREGKLAQAIASLNAELKERPTDVQRRTFLFELLCFAGDYERAGKQLDVLLRGDPESTPGILAYQGILEAEGERRKMFATGAFPASKSEPQPVRGRLNGQPFERLEDADPRLGARLEVYIAGRYSWIPLEHLASLTVERPHKLRDLLWAPAHLKGGAALEGADVGDVLLPVLTPAASAHADERVRLGRVTEWVELPDGQEAPVGQKMLLVDDEEFPILEVRELEIDSAAPA
jgi:type VI secretion system protein ImpE